MTDTASTCTCASTVEEVVARLEVSSISPPTLSSYHDTQKPGERDSDVDPSHVSSDNVIDGAPVDIDCTTPASTLSEAHTSITASVCDNEETNVATTESREVGSSECDDATTIKGDEAQRQAAASREAAIRVAAAVTPPDMRAVIARAQEYAENAARNARDKAGAGSPDPYTLRLYWALGPHKWREAVDGRHWEPGPGVYDWCLHKGNQGHVDPGYIGAMHAGFVAIAGLIGVPTSADGWYLVHGAAMAHTHEYGSSIAGQVRTGANYVFVPPSWEGSPNGITATARAEITAMQPHVCELVPVSEEAPDSSDGLGDEAHGFRLCFLESDRDTIVANLQSFIDEYYKRIARVRADASATTVDLVRPAAWLHQAMVRLEPSRDGNLRTATLFLNKHLVELGLHPALLGWPDGAEVYEHERWLRDIIVGMEWWRLHCEQIAPELAASLRKIDPPPWP